MVRVAKLALPAPDFDAEPTVCVPLNVDWLPVLLSAIARLELQASWQPGTDTERADQQVLGLTLAIKNAMECGTMPFDVRQKPDEPCKLQKTDDGATWTTWANLRLCPPLIRSTPGGGIEVSADDGTTWTPGAAAPPTPRDPGAGETVNRCLAAANAAAVIKLAYEEIRARYATGGDVIALAAFALVLLGFIFVFPPAIIIVIEAIGLMVAVGGFSAAVFDADDEEALKCILYCNATAAPDGSVTFDFSAVTSEMQAHEYLPVQIAGLLLPIFGADGLNRAGATTSITAAECDCPDCAEAVDWCYLWDFSTGQQGWNGFANPVAPEYTAGLRWKSANSGGGTYVNIEYTFATPQTLKSVSVSVGISSGYSGTGSGTWISALIGGVETPLTAAGYDPPPGWSTLSVAGTWENVTRVRVNSQINGVITSYLDDVQMTGVGVHPVGEDNC
jgi:hypothetical protein